MEDKKIKKLSTENYKGTRDFYPEDMQFRNWMFGVMKTVVKSYGYQEYDGPMLESFELYAAKSGDEIAGKQLYDFIDKGERRVAIRPEMTPTLARMVAAKARELPRPIRWYSIPNLWRYEAPGHGRLREHWQLNVDIFGVNSFRAEVEIISLACDILFAFKAPRDSFKVKISHRKILNDFLQNTLSLSVDKIQSIARLLDKKNKLKKDEFEQLLEEQLNNPKEQITLIYKYLNSNIETIKQFEGIDSKTLQDLNRLFEELSLLGLQDVLEFDPSIIRGFDYYTSFIFEIFDTSPDNKRSLYGGGRYDNLTGLFSNEQLSGIGFGLGDVTLENFLRTHKLVPDLNQYSTIFIPLLNDSNFIEVMKLSKELRANGINCELNLEESKFGKQITTAEKKGYQYLLLFGDNEIQSNSVQLKNLHSKTQSTINRADLISSIKKELSL